MFENLKNTERQIPVTVITGFLGSGKTSFLSHLLTLDEMANSAVIINEFGEYSLDHLLVEHTNDQTFELPDGCLCCNARGELIEKMLYLATSRNSGELDFDRIIIETSGIADTANLIENLWNNRQIRSGFHLSKIITLVSALEWFDSQSNFNEAGSQLAISDTIIVSKTDLLPAKKRDQELAHLMAGIELLNSAANRYFLPLSAEQLKEITSNGPAEPNHNIYTKSHTDHSRTYKTFTLIHAAPLPINTIELFMDILLTRYAKDLLRVKGLILTLENPACPLVIQAVKSTLSPLAWLKQWSVPPQTQLTFIHTGNNSEKINCLFESMLDIPSVDQPDKAALRDNPLSIPGLGNFKPE